MPKTVEPFRAAIRTEAIRFLLPFICREETRYYLNGVHLEAHRDGGVLAVATDGHKMGVAYDDIGAAEGLPDNVIVRVVPEIERDLKGAFEDSVPHRDMVRWLVVDQEMARVVVAGSAAAALEQPVLSSATKGFAHGTLIDGQYPDWRSVVPARYEGVVAPVFNAEYLRQISECFAGLAGRHGSMQLVSAGKHEPALLRFAHERDEPDYFAVLMPLRGPPELNGALPDWAGIQEPQGAS